MTTVLYEVRDAVATITLNRPEKLNAIDAALLDQLTESLRTAGASSEVRAILVRGAGKSFCAGADLTTFATLQKPSQVRDYLVSRYRPLIDLFGSVEKPVIAAVRGAAAGAGASIALACDFRVMSDEAYLLQAFINIGLVPDAGASWFLVRQIGYSRALELAISGAKIAASKCLEWGLCNRVVGASELDEAALAWAQELAARPTYGVGLTKRLLRQATELDLATMIEMEAALQPAALMSEDHTEGIGAFLGKREPEFKGH